MQRQSRPLGVSIIANLSIIGGILGIVGVTLSAGGAAKESSIGAMSLGQSLYALVTGYGLRKGKGWAWTISVIGIFIVFVTGIYAMIFTMLPMTSSLTVQFGNAEAGFVNDIIIITFVIIFGIGGLFLYYLYRPHVKAYFEKAMQPPT